MMPKIIVWPGNVRWDEGPNPCRRILEHLYPYPLCTCMYKVTFGLCVFCLFMASQDSGISLSHSLSLSLSLSHSQTFSLLLHFQSFLPHLPSLYLSNPLSVGGMRWPSVVQWELDRDWGGERERVRQSGEEWALLWYCNCSQSGIEQRERERRCVSW